MQENQKIYDITIIGGGPTDSLRRDRGLLARVRGSFAVVTDALFLFSEWYERARSEDCHAKNMALATSSGDRPSSEDAIAATSTLTSNTSGKYINVSARSARATGSSPGDTRCGPASHG